MVPPSYGLGAKFNETHYNYFEQAINYITKTKGACQSPCRAPSLPPY